MRYSLDESFSEVMHRSDSIKKEREKRTIRALSGMTACFTMLFFAVVFSVSGSGTSSAPGSFLASFLLGSEAGGYVLVGVIAFLTGAVITVLCIRYKKKK